MVKWILTLELVLGVTFIFSPRVAQSASDCYSARDREELIKITVSRVKQINYNYTEALDYYIKQDYPLCSNISILSTIASGINIFIPNKWIKAAVFGILAPTPIAVCGYLKYRKKSRYVRPESAYIGDFVNILREASDKDARQTCAGLDPATINTQYFIKELSSYWE